MDEEKVILEIYDIYLREQLFLFVSVEYPFFLLPSNFTWCQAFKG